MAKRTTENTLPYESTSSGRKALDELQKVLRAFGAGSFGCMEDFAKGEVIVQFEWNGRRVSIRASAKGYAAAWLRIHPYNFRRAGTQKEYEMKALQIGNVAVYSILRDWVKGQVTAVETGMLSFEGAFLGQILLASGETVMERVERSDMLKLGAPT